MVTQSFLVMLSSSLDKYLVLEVICLWSDKEKISKLEIIDQVLFMQNIEAVTESQRQGPPVYCPALRWGQSPCSQLVSEVRVK